MKNYTRIAAKVVNGHVVLQLNDAETRMLPARAIGIASLILKAAEECMDSADGRLELNPSQRVQGTSSRTLPNSEKCPMSVRAKFKVQSVTTYEHNSEVKLTAVYGDDNPENKAFFTATPSASISLTVVKPEVAARFPVGKAFYVDFTEAE